VRLALSAHLVPPPTVPPASTAAAAGSAAVATSAGKLVLICSLAAAGGVGTAALVKSRLAVENRQKAPAVARVAPRSTQALATPVVENLGAEPAPSPASGTHDIPRPALANRGESRAEPLATAKPTTEWRRGDIHRGQLAARDQEPLRALGSSSTRERSALPATPPAAAVVPEPGSEIAPRPASASAPEPDWTDLAASSWRNSDLPRPVPGRRVTRVTSAESVSGKAGPSQMGRGGADARSSEAPNTGGIQASGDAAAGPTPTRLATRRPFQTRSEPARKTCSAASELKLLSAAQAALRENDGQGALDLIEEHSRSCPSAVFWEEQSAARVLALCLLHQEEQALRVAARLSARSPRSPLLARLRSSCAAAALATPAKR